MPASEAWKREARRKAFHQVILLYIPAYFWLGFPRVLWAAALFCALFWLVDSARLRGWDGGLISRHFGGIMRAKEHGRLTGSFYVTLGVLVMLALYGDNHRIVVASILALTLGDAASPVVGLRFGWRPYKVWGTQRSVDGTLAGYIVVTAGGLLCGFSPAVAAGAALAFSVVDTLPVPPDDNLWIPVIYGAALYGLEAGLQRVAGQ